MFPQAIPDRTISVYTTPRPMRMAIILNADAASAINDFQEACHYLFHLWGGLHSLIVPSSAGTLTGAWYRLVELLDPDCVYAVPTLTEETISKINRELAPAVLRHDLERNNRHSGRLHVFGMIREQPARITTVPRTIAGLSSTLFTPHLIYLTGTGGDDPYRKFIAQNFGTLSDSVDILDAFRDLDHQAFNIPEQDAHKLFAVLVEHGNNALTPDRLSSYRAHPLTDGRGGRYEHRFTVVVGDTLDDLALARAIRMSETHRGGRRSLWLPSALCGNNDAITMLRQFIVKSFWSGDNVKQCQIVSLSMSSAVLGDLANQMNADWRVRATVEEIDRDTLGFPESVDSFMPATVRPGWGPGFDINLTRARQCSLVDRAGVIELQLPEFLSGAAPQDQVMVDLEIPFLRSDRSSVIRVMGSPELWRLPCRQGLAAAFVQSGGLARITRIGLPSAVSSAQTDRIQIRIPTPSELFHCWATNQYINEYDVVGRRQHRFDCWRVSDEGQFLEALIRLFGSPYACGHTLAEPFWGAALRQMALGMTSASDVSEASVRRALSLLQEHEGGIDVAQPDDRHKAAGFLARHIRASIKQAKGLSLNQLRRLFGETKKAAPNDHWYWSNATWKELEQDRELDRFVDADILRMGIRVRCDECLIEQWIPVNEMAVTVTCRGCGARVRLEAAPEWCYQVNTLAAEAIRRRGVIAVVQALYAAEEKALARMFVVLPSLDVFEAHASQPFTEIDLVYFAERELVLGEVKANPYGFSQADLDKLSAVAADLLPNRVVLAAPGQEWPSEIEERVGQLSIEHRVIGVTWEIRKLKQ